VIDILVKPLDGEKINDVFRKIEARTEVTPAVSPEIEDGRRTEESVKRIPVERNMTGAFVLDFEKRLIETMQSVQKSPVVLDLSGTTMIDSRGMAVCIGLKKECDKKNVPLTIELTPDLHKVFKILKLSRIIDMKEVDRS
jgi:anti-anti-sigma factor